LRQSGLDVVVLDKAAFPRDKICGGWITPFVLEALQIDPEAYRRGRTLQPISSFRVSCLGDKESFIEYRKPISYGIRRCEFDEYLLRRCGAELHENVPVKAAQRSGYGWMVNGQFKARLLIGAGGHFCPVSRLMGSRKTEQPVVAQETEFLMDARQAVSCPISGEAPELYFCRDLQGYGWCFRKNNFLNIGLGRLDQHKLSAHVNAFVEFLRERHKIDFDLPRSPAGHAYLLYGRSPRQLVHDGLIVIGDSAGLAYAQSGEGIRPAVESGLIAADVIVAAQGSYSAERLSPYSKLLNDRFGGKMSAVESLGKHVPRWLRNLAGRILLRNQQFCRSTVVERWFLRVDDKVLQTRHRRFQDAKAELAM
jgi:flavin-dependent dehydrogenase